MPACVVRGRHGAHRPALLDFQRQRAGVALAAGIADEKMPVRAQIAQRQA